MRESDIDAMGLNISGRDITNLRYADDTALLSDNLTSMKRILHRVDTEGKKVGLQLNAKKSKVMQITPKEFLRTSQIKVNGTSLENVKNFKYLESIKIADRTCKKDITTRIAIEKQGTVQLTNLWKYRSISMHQKIKILKCLVWPVMLYGCETWTMNKTEDKKIEAAELCFYRRLLRVCWTEHRRNKSILQELGTTRSILGIINTRKLKYIGHVSRNTKTQLMKTVLQGKIQSERKKGRPPASYINTICKFSGVGLGTISQRSQDREKMEKLCEVEVCGSEHRPR